VLVITTQDLKEKSQYWRESWDFIVLTKSTSIEKPTFMGGTYSI
jgi:hypothetical protein